jgi:short-subunit dehydrogenase
MSKSLVIITGASRGIGRAIALAISEAVAVVDKAACSSTHSSIDGSSLHSSIDGQPQPLTTTMTTTTTTMILISRSADALQETAQLVEKRGRGMITTQCHDMDLSNLDTIVDDFNSVLEKSSYGADDAGSCQYKSCWLINNAGSLGPVGLASSFSSSSCGESIKELRRAVDLNLTSSIWLTSQFAKRFLTTSKSIRIVNISSLCALEPFPTMSIYCAGEFME